MNNIFWTRLNFYLLALTVIVLPWQTKLIVRSAPSNYWEISIFASFIILWLTLLTALPVWPQLKLRLSNLAPSLRLSLVITILFGLIAVIFSPDPLLAGYRTLLFFSALGFSFLVINLSLPRRRYLVKLLVISLALQAAIGLGQFFTQTSWSSEYLGIAYHQAGDLGATVIETEGGRWLRAYGASDHPNVFGGLMALAAMGSLYLLFTTASRCERVLFLGIYIIFLVAAFVSFSRAAALALAVGLLVSAIDNRRFLIINKRLTTAILVLSVVLGVLFSLQYRDLFWARSHMGNRLEQISLHDRHQFNQRAWQDFLQRPWWGSGLGVSTLLASQQDQLNKVARPSWAYQPAHNYWLLAAAESGIFFALALACLWFKSYQKSRLRRLTGLFLVLFILTLFDHWLFSLPFGAILVFLVLALMW